MSFPVLRPRWESGFRQTRGINRRSFEPRVETKGRTFVSHTECVLLWPPKCGGEARYRRGQVLRVRGDDIQQLAREDGVDRLAVAFGEAFQGQDLEAGDAHFQAGEAEELGMASARSAPRAAPRAAAIAFIGASCGQKSMPKEGPSLPTTASRPKGCPRLPAHRLPSMRGCPAWACTSFAASRPIPREVCGRSQNSGSVSFAGEDHFARSRGDVADDALVAAMRTTVTMR